MLEGALRAVRRGGGGELKLPPLRLLSPPGVPSPQPPLALRPRAGARSPQGASGRRRALRAQAQRKLSASATRTGPRGGGGAGLQGRRGREAKAKAAASSGADSRWAKGLKGSQSGRRGGCQSRGALQSHPCHFQNPGPTVRLQCGAHSANRWRTEWERE